MAYDFIQILVFFWLYGFVLLVHPHSRRMDEFCLEWKEILCLVFWALQGAPKGDLLCSYVSKDGLQKPPFIEWACEWANQGHKLWVEMDWEAWMLGI